MGAKIGVNLVTTLWGHKQSVYALCKADEAAFYSVGGDGYLVRWDYLSGEDGVAQVQIPETVFALQILPDGTLLAGAQSGALYSVKPGAQPRKWLAHEKGIYAIALLPNGLFITTGGDGCAVIWNSDFEIVLKQKIATQALRCFVYLQNLGVFAFGSSDWKIYITNPDLKILEVLEGHAQSVFALAYDAEKQTLFSGGRDAILRIWDLITATQINQIAAHWFHIHALSLNTSGNLLASGSMDKTIKIWDTKSAELLKVIDLTKFEAHKSSVNCLLWLNEHTLVSSGDDKSVKVWEITF